MAVELREHRQSKRFARMKLLHKAGGSRNQDVYINVTALVDMMTVLVIFLVMQFNATGEMLFVSKDLTMAKAEHGQELTRVPIISLSNSGNLYFEGSVIASDLAPKKAGDDWNISALEAKLLDNRKRFEALGTNRLEQMSPQEDPTSTVNLQIDKDVDYTLIKQVIYTCELAGYGRIRLAVGDASQAENGRQI